MLVPAFTIKINQQIQQGLVVVGKFDGTSPSLACATTGGKILLHSPHEGSNQGNTNDGQLPQIRYLNFNRAITALACQSLGQNVQNTKAQKKNADTGAIRDLLFVGTQSNLLAYDVEKNSDVFFRDVGDGVNTLIVGKIASAGKEDIVLAGGNCSVLGFDNQGNEVFWTVTGDNISAMAFCDVNTDGVSELLVGSEDFEIRVFRNEELLEEVTEADKISHLCPVTGNKFAYGLDNSTVGVYKGTTNRLWRVKTKNKVTALEAYDIDLDGVPEVISGWSNGAFNVRKDETGEVIFKDKLTCPVSGIVKSDYRMDGKVEVMVCGELGEIRGFLPADAEIAVMAESVAAKANAEDQRAIAELQNRKQQLTSELRSLELAVKATKNVGSGGDGGANGMPASTTLSYSLVPDLQNQCLNIRAEVSTDVQIVNIIAVDPEGAVLDGREVLAFSPPIASSRSRSAVLPIRPPKYTACKLRIQTHLASRALSSQLHLFEQDLFVPKFSCFAVQDEASREKLPPQPQGEALSQVTIRVGQTIPKIVDWLKSIFIVPTLKFTPDKLFVHFVSACGPANSRGADVNSSCGAALQLRILAARIETQDDSEYVKMQLRCEDMELAGEIIQDMAKYFKIVDLEAQANFPEEFQQFEDVLGQVTDYNAARLSLTADMADDAQKVKALIVRAEDSRLLVDMKTMRRAYTELYSINSQLIAGYNARANNHEGLLKALKEVNKMIQKAANLRIGKYKTCVISECRAAVKVNNLPALFRIIKQGSDVIGVSSAAPTVGFSGGGK